jgi:hypothetical protein
MPEGGESVRDSGEESMIRRCWHLASKPFWLGASVVFGFGLRRETDHMMRKAP